MCVCLFVLCITCIKHGLSCFSCCVAFGVVYCLLLSMCCVVSCASDLCCFVWRVCLFGFVFFVVDFLFATLMFFWGVFWYDLFVCFMLLC